MRRWGVSVLAGIAAVLVCIVGLAWLEYKQSQERRQSLKRDTHIVARQFASHLEGALERHFIALQQMTNFWENSQEVTEQEFYDFASSTLQLTPLPIRLSAIDSTLHVRWIYPPLPNRSLVGVDIRKGPDAYETLCRARDTEKAALSPPLRLAGGEQGFIVAAPIFKAGKFEGAVVCSLRSGDFFGAVALAEVAGRYDETVRDSGTVLFASGPDRSSGGPEIRAGESFSLGGRSWDVMVEPRPEVVTASLTSGKATFWALGSVVALLVGALVGAGTNRAVRIGMRLRTQRAALEETRQRLDGARQQLLQAEKMTALGELVAGVAHEINNPLASVLGYTQLALQREPRENIRKYLETASSEAERAGKIVRNLLTFARKQPPEKKQVSLNDVIEKTLELKAYHFKTSQIELEKNLHPNLPKTMLDEHQIQQVLLNLLNNAEQALTERGRGGTIRVVTGRGDGSIEVRVIDDGPGIPAEIQQRVFEPFFTTKAEGRGTGLGLSLCYGIVQEHGGTIRVESQPGIGTTFVVELPIMEEPAVSSKPQPAAITEVMSGLRVLVVDDEPAVQGFLAALLRSRGHDVGTASDVPDAVRLITAEDFDVIISDMRMPHGSGKDIHDAAAMKSARLAGRIVFLTGDGASAETRQYVLEQGNQVLSKPCRIEEIDRAIANAVAGKGSG